MTTYFNVLMVHTCVNSISVLVRQNACRTHTSFVGLIIHARIRVLALKNTIDRFFSVFLKEGKELNPANFCGDFGSHPA